MPDTWLRVGVRSPSDELAGLFAEGLVACGGSAVVEEDDRLVSYIPVGATDDAVRLGARLREQLNVVLGFDPGELELDEVADQDWLALWRRGLQPRQVGSRIVVSPTWVDVTVPAGTVMIRIDPQMAFGTGEHASTRGVLRLMQDVVAAGDRLLDVGSGSAILAIAGAKLGAMRVLAVESDAEAMPNAAENVGLNDVAGQVTLICQMVDSGFLEAHGQGAFDGIVANVLSSVLLPLLPAFHAALARGGWLILSGILVEEAALMRSAAAAAGFGIDAEDAEQQWWSVRLRPVTRQ
jgi:ribosomal protein L11 methyltransferase